VQIAWVAHSAEITGAGLTFVESVTALASAGHEVHAVLPGDGPLHERLGAATSVQICHHNPWAGRRRPPPVAARHVAYNLARSVPALAGLLRELEVELVVSDTITTMAGGLAARRRGLPHAWSIREFGVAAHDIHFLLGRRATWALMRRLAPVSFVASHTLRAYLATHLRGMELHVVRPTVAVGPPPSTPDATDGPLVLAVVGFQAPGKRQLDAIRALALVLAAGVDARLELIGDGDRDYVARLHREVAALGLAGRVRFVPQAADAFPAICASDAVLSCSIHEGLGRVVIEAMKAGRPVIGADSGATPELIRHGWNGLLYPPGDVAALADRIGALAVNPTRAIEIGRRAQAWAAESFNADRHRADLEAGMERLLAARS
jgi:glycosyltransferase involved in cell wall biosynthesis